MHIISGLGCMITMRWVIYTSLLYPCTLYNEHTSLKKLANLKETTMFWCQILAEHWWGSSVYIASPNVLPELSLVPLHYISQCFLIVATCLFLLHLLMSSQSCCFLLRKYNSSFHTLVLLPWRIHAIKNSICIDLGLTIALHIHFSLFGCFGCFREVGVSDIG